MPRLQPQAATKSVQPRWATAPPLRLVRAEPFPHTQPFRLQAQETAKHAAAGPGSLGFHFWMGWTVVTRPALALGPVRMV